MPAFPDVMTSVAMCPPGELKPQQPELSLRASSQVMITMPFCWNHVEFSTGARLLFSHVSPALISWLLELLAQAETPPCISSQSLGTR